MTYTLTEEGREAALLALKRKSVPVGECRIWTGAIRTDGYGQQKVQGYNWSAHRLSYAVHYARIPAGAVVRHTCDNPLCVRPEHLVIGAPADNSADMVSRGRSLAGDRSPRAGLTAEQVAEIYNDPRGPTELAKVYGVWKGTISAIKTGRSWSSVTGAGK
jgi:hypothetical protein